MPNKTRRNGRNLLAWLGLAASLCWLAGCGSLCTKHLYLDRDTPQKSPPGQMALIIADPNILKAVMPGAQVDLQGAEWAPEQPSQPNEVYRLSIESLDGQRVYQGLCLDSPLTCIVEVRAGSRQVTVRIERYGPWGMEKFIETVRLNLQAGQTYFLRPDWQELLNKRLALKLEPLPEAYTPLLRARVIDRQRQTNKSASLD